MNKYVQEYLEKKDAQKKEELKEATSDFKAKVKTIKKAKK